MGNLDTRVILAGQPLNVLGALGGAAQAADAVNAVKRGNALADLYRTQGAGILAGDRSALNALAGLDPNAALGVQQTQLGMQATRQNMELSREQLEQIRFNMKTAMEEKIAREGAAAAAAEAEQMQRMIQASFGAKTEEQFQAFLQQNAPDLVGKVTLANRDMLAASLMDGMADAMEMAQGPKPDYGVTDGYFYDKKNPAAGAQPVPGLPTAAPKQSEAEQEIARLMSLGISRDVAIRIKEGVYATDRHPVTGELQIVDKSTGQVIHGNDKPTPAPINTELSFGKSYQGAGDAFGAEGFAKGVANTIGDVTGLGTPFPDVQGAQSDFGVLRENLTNKIADAYDGRVPAFLLNNIQNLTPKAGSPFEGPEGAQAKLQALGRSLVDERNSVIEQLRTRTLSPTDKAKLETRLTILESSLADIGNALSGFRTGDGNTTSGGVKWKVVQ